MKEIESWERCRGEEVEVNLTERAQRFRKENSREVKRRENTANVRERFSRHLLVSPPVKLPTELTVRVRLLSSGGYFPPPDPTILSIFVVSLLRAAPSAEIVGASLSRMRIFDSSAVDIASAILCA